MLLFLLCRGGRERVCEQAAVAFKVGKEASRSQCWSMRIRPRCTHGCSSNSLPLAIANSNPFAFHCTGATYTACAGSASRSLGQLSWSGCCHLALPTPPSSSPSALRSWGQRERGGHGCQLLFSNGKLQGISASQELQRGLVFPVDARIWGQPMEPIGGDSQFHS